MTWMSNAKITEIVDFNPARPIDRGSIAPFVGMAALPTNAREISTIGEREFKGSGSRFQNGDTLFARITPCLENGKTAKVSGLPDDANAHGSTEFIVMSAKLPEYDEDYVYYLARLPEFRSFAQSRMEGTSGRQRVPWQTLAEFELDSPKKETRKDVGQLLARFDDKIELNRQLNQTLEQIAQAIFKSWFVDFEPVKAKQHIRALGGNDEQTECAAQAVIAGAVNLDVITTATNLSTLDQQLIEALNEKLANQSDAQHEQLATTASHFPDHLVESELGLIPEGWAIQSLGAITSKLRRGISPKYMDQGGVAVINQKCIRDHTINFSLCKRNDPARRSVEGRKVQVNDVLINSTGVGTLGRVAPVRHLAEETVVDSHVTMVRADAEHVSPNYLIQFVLLKESFIEASGAGSTGQTELRKQVLEEIQLCLPPLELQGSLESLISSMNSQYASNEQQTQSLAVLRDTLLPRLLSGELDIAGEGSR